MFVIKDHLSRFVTKLPVHQSPGRIWDTTAHAADALKFKTAMLAEIALQNFPHVYAVTCHITEQPKVCWCKPCVVKRRGTPEAMVFEKVARKVSRHAIKYRTREEILGIEEGVLAS